jgi:hypothetical protein
MRLEEGGGALDRLGFNRAELATIDGHAVGAGVDHSASSGRTSSLCPTYVQATLMHRPYSEEAVGGIPPKSPAAGM